MEFTQCKRIAACLCGVWLLAGTAVADYTPSQVQLLDKARGVGHVLAGMPETVQAILLTESSAGVHLIGDAGQSLGPMQVQLRTAHFLADKYAWLPKRKRPEDYAQLLLQEDYGLLFGVAYYDYCRKLYRYQWKKSVVCYNAGHNRVARMTRQEIDNHPYLRKVKGHLQQIRKWRKSA